MRINAKDELLKKCQGKTIKAGYVYHACWDVGDDPGKTYMLPEKYTKEELDKFLSDLDFKYDNGYGWQELGGIIWFDDGSWLERDEYDGSEWWDYKEIPGLLEELKRD